MSIEWKTRKEKLLEWFRGVQGKYHLKEIMDALSYPNLQSFIDDFNFIARKIKREGKKISIQPITCLKCGYQQHFNSGKLKIPSKCPQCHEERFTTPMIKIKNKL
ncbi:MAG: hypothetical protein ACTSU4_04960 [Promethearchaeota archaeon]